MIDKNVSHYAKEPEGVRASLYASIAASETASIAARDKIESQLPDEEKDRILHQKHFQTMKLMPFLRRILVIR